MAESVGLIPSGALPRFAWQLVFFPLEYLAYMPSATHVHCTIDGKQYCSGARSSQTVPSGASVGNYFRYTWNGPLVMVLNCYRKFAIVNLESRAVVDRLYVCLQHHFRVYSVWVKFQLPPTLLSESIPVIDAAFVSIRYTDLPLILYMVYPNTACNLMIIVFWLCYDSFRIARASDEVIGRLQSENADYLRPLPRAGRIQVLKRAKVMKEIQFAVGELATVTLNLPIAMWEAILNQILFLLSF